MAKHGSTYVLGVGLSHNGAACLLRDGQIAVAIEKERLTRVKHDGWNDTVAVDYCLQTAGISLSDVDVIVQNANFSMLESGNDWFAGARPYAKHAPLVTISHHLAHAYSAIGTSPYDDCCVFVLDGSGSSYDNCLDRTDETSAIVVTDPELTHLYFEKDSYYRFANGRLETIYKDFSPWGYYLKNMTMVSNGTLHSIAGMYAGTSIYIFGGYLDAGKTMGLAPYGRPDRFTEPIFELRDGRAFVNPNWHTRFERPVRTREDFKARFQEYADIALWMQKETERAVLYQLKDRYQRCPGPRLAYAGGVALNAVLNTRILAESDFSELYVQPAAQDNGLAIGCAYYGWMHVLGRERPKHRGHMWFGRSYAGRDLTAALGKWQDQIVAQRQPSYIDDVARQLAAGKVVAWFQGGCEFGPRALGQRSLLAHPGSMQTRHFINGEIKQREEFRPFAPAVLKEACTDYFECPHDSPYMLFIAPVRKDKLGQLDAVTHVDGSARVQTVTRELNGPFYDLIAAFATYSGLPVLLNTSLNGRGMPIIETPEEALEFFVSRPIDLLVIDDVVITKREAQVSSALLQGQGVSA